MSGIGVGMTLPSLSAAAVNRLPADQYAVGSAVNQATRQIGSVLGVAITVLLLGHAGLERASFTPLYATHIALALIRAAVSAGRHATRISRNLMNASRFVIVHEDNDRARFGSWKNARVLCHRP